MLIFRFLVLVCQLICSESILIFIFKKLLIRGWWRVLVVLVIKLLPSTTFVSVKIQLEQTQSWRIARPVFQRPKSSCDDMAFSRAWIIPHNRFSIELRICVFDFYFEIVESSWLLNLWRMQIQVLYGLLSIERYIWKEFFLAQLMQNYVLVAWSVFSSLLLSR